jgi:CRISPR/Cas system Type II protein with McrA/HNH and RuvC-like nuclease domain
MSISAEKVRVQNEGMTKTNSTAVAPASGRGNVTRITAARRPSSTAAATDRAREARRGLKPRSDRFAHLKRMHD